MAQIMFVPRCYLAAARGQSARLCGVDKVAVHLNA